MSSKLDSDLHDSRVRIIIHMLTGLLTCQCLAILHLYLNLSELKLKSELIAGTGYIFVPGLAVLKQALLPQNLYLSAFFVSISIGSGITLFSVAITIVKKSSTIIHKSLLWFIIFCWIALLIDLNRNGAMIVSSSYFIIIPLVIILLDRKLPVSVWIPSFKFDRIYYPISMILIIILWLGPASQTTLTNVRDSMLLTHSIGTKANQIYYDHSFAAASLFTSQSQKSINTIFISDDVPEEVSASIPDLLNGLSFVQVPSPVLADLVMRYSENQLILENQSSIGLAVGIEEFNAAPMQTFKRFSDLADPYRVVRPFAYYALLLGFPLIMIFLFHSGLTGIIKLRMSTKIAGRFATTLMLISGLLFLIKLHSIDMGHNAASNPDILLSSDRITDRLAAYHMISKRHPAITAYPSWSGLHYSKLIPDRLWLANLLANAKDSQSPAILKVLLTDSSSNVRCQAMLSLGKRKHFPAKEEISAVLASTKSWYLENCAIRSLQMMR